MAPDDRSRALRDALVDAIGFLEGGLVHAHTAAFYRIAVIYERLGAGFTKDPEVREVCAVVLRLLRARRGQGVTSVRESDALRRLEQVFEAV